MFWVDFSFKKTCCSRSRWVSFFLHEAFRPHVRRKVPFIVPCRPVSPVTWAWCGFIISCHTLYPPDEHRDQCGAHCLLSLPSPSTGLPQTGAYLTPITPLAVRVQLRESRQVVNEFNHLSALLHLHCAMIWLHCRLPSFYRLLTFFVNRHVLFLLNPPEYISLKGKDSVCNFSVDFRVDLLAVCLW